MRFSRRAFVAGLVALLPERARAFFFQASINGLTTSIITLPSGVVLQAIDGETISGGTVQSNNFYASNGFTFASASVTWNPTAAGGNPAIIYTHGWDDPKFFPLGPFFVPFNTATPTVYATQYGKNGCNTTWGLVSSSGNLALVGTLGLSNVALYQVLGQTISVDGNLGNETVGILTFDEPGADAQAITVPIAGNALTTFTNCSITGNALTISGTVSPGVAFWAWNSSYSLPILTGAGITGSGTTAQITAYSGSNNGGPGVYSVTTTANVAGPITITQAAVAPLATAVQNHRFMFVNMPGTSFFANQPPLISTAAGNINCNAMLNIIKLAPDGVTSRQLDMIGDDLYFFTFGFDQAGSGRSQAISNCYGTSNPQMTIDQVKKGSHYGNFINYFRKNQFGASGNRSIPITTAIDNSNANTGIAYDTQGVEINWAVWASIIHGCRGIIYFNSVDATSPSGCTGAFDGSDNFHCTAFQSVAAATFTATIGSYTSGVATMTATGTVTGTICPGMVSSAGINGQIVVLQQTSNITISAAGKAATYLVYLLSGAGTVTGTITLGQTNIGMGGSGAAFSFSSKGMVDCVSQTNTLVRTIAPVINSPNAVAASTGTGYVKAGTTNMAYVFPSDTGVLNTFPPQTFAFGTATGIDCCAKYYTGGSYPATTGDTISNGFYIFASTRYAESNTPIISASFTVNDPLATSITVIGESRSISFTSGQGTSAAVFTDNFDFAWTCRIYRVNH